MVLGKQGVFFTLTSILFVAVLFLLFSPSDDANFVDTGAIVVDATNSFRVQLEQNYIPTLLRQRGYEALAVLSLEADADGRWLSLPDDFESALLQGTYGGGPLPASYQTLPQAFSNLTAAAAEIDYNVSLVATDITVVQTGAFQALVIANISYNLSSRDSSVVFRRNMTNQVVFTLIGIPDLYYNRQAPLDDWQAYQPFFTRDWNSSLFFSFASADWYATNNQSPSIFNRLQGNSSAHPFGIETTIPIGVVPAGNLTVIDYEYFSGVGFECTYQHPGVYPSLRMSIYSLADYNITDATLAQGPATCPAPPSSS